MARAILSDANIRGHVMALVAILESEDWRDLWRPLNLPLLAFRDLGLEQDVSDAVLWDVCQREQVVLITANRNANAPDSLEATLRARNTAESLPVLTLADPQRVLRSRAYAERATARMLDYLMNIDRVRGAGRLYLP
jgi:hypothetical protein